MKRERLEYTLILLLVLLCSGVLFYFLMNYALPITAPFLIAWGVAFAVRRPADFLHKKTRIPGKIWRPALAIFLVLASAGVITLLVWWLVDFISGVLEDITGGGKLYTFLAGFSEPKLPIFGSEIPKELAVMLSDGIRELLSSLLNYLGGILTSVVSFLPKALVFILITLISLIYFSVDLERINRGVRSVLPEKLSIFLSSAKTKMFDAIGKYVKSYLQIMLITFFIMLVGFLVLRIRDAVIIALIVAALDLLPVIGVGVVLLPWSIFAFATGDSKIGIGLIVIFLIYTVVRELLEPKILGKSLNVHPIITLISLYVGYAVFGVAGLILFPLLAMAICPLFKKDKSAEVD